MDDKTLRNAGIALGGGALAVAVAIASMSGGGLKPTPFPSPPEAAAPTISGPSGDVSAAPSAPTPAVEPAAAVPPPEDLTTTFIVRFKAAHPLGKAQALAAKGRLTAAAAAAKKALAAGDMKGLCFERFTLGGAETVLRLCPDTQTSAKAWLTKLRTSPDVEYADANVTVDVEKKQQ